MTLSTLVEHATCTALDFYRVYKVKFTKAALKATLIDLKGNSNESEIAKVARKSFENVQTHANATHACLCVSVYLSVCVCLPV